MKGPNCCIVETVALIVVQLYNELIYVTGEGRKSPLRPHDHPVTESDNSRMPVSDFGIDWI